jgi:hypothetical protein
MIVFAIKNGNWSDSSIWCYQQVPSLDDIVYSAGKTITIDTDVTCSLITTDSPIDGQFYGGEFILEDGLVFTGNVATNTSTCLKFSGNSSTIIGNVSGGNGGYSAGVENLGTGTLNISGTVMGGGGGYSYGINNCSTGTINLFGESLLGLGGYSWGIWNSTNGKIILNGSESNNEGGYLTNG